MKSFIIFGAILLAVAVVEAEDILKEEDVALLQDEKFFREFYACLMDQEPCSDKMVVYRDTIPRYFETKCGTCSQKEKELFEKSTKFVAEKYPKEFKDLMDKLTPKAEE